MADEKRRADVSARRAGTGYDVGLHAQDELGTFQLGVCVDGTPGAGESLGLFVDAPRVGKLRLAFAIEADGVTRLAALERRDDHGKSLPVAAVLAIDEGQLLKLKGELANVKAQLEEKLSLLDEARDRAAALNDDLAAAREKIQTQASLLEEHTKTSGLATSELEARLALERNEKVEALAEREKLRGELKTLESASAEAALLRVQVDEQDAKVKQLELEAREATEKLSQLEQEHAAARSTLDERAQSADAARQELATAQEDLAQARLDLEAAQRDLDDARAERDSARDEREKVRDEAAAHKAELDRVKAEADEAKAQAESASHERDSHSGQLKRLEAEVDQKNAELELLRTEKAGVEGELAIARTSQAGEADTLRASLEATEALMKTQASELEELRAKLVAAGDQAEAVAKANADRDEARAVARTLQSNAARLQAERDEARNVARSLHARTNTGEIEAVRSDANEARATLDAERKIASQLVTEKQRLQLQIESLSRQLENERTARAKLATERDDWREKAQLATGMGATAKKDFSREETKPYELSGMTQTQPAMPAVVEVDPKTDPIALIPRKKK